MNLEYKAVEDLFNRYIPQLDQENIPITYGATKRTRTFNALSTAMRLSKEHPGLAQADVEEIVQQEFLDGIEVALVSILLDFHNSNGQAGLELTAPQNEGSWRSGRWQLDIVAVRNKLDIYFEVGVWRVA